MTVMHALCNAFELADPRQPQASPVHCYYRHFSKGYFQIRQHSGWRFPTAQDKEDLENWLRIRGGKEAHTADTLFDSACERLRSLRVELPAEGELERVVNAALNGFFQDIHRWISDALALDVRADIDALLVVPESAAVSGFEGFEGRSRRSRRRQSPS
jgi:hypothetical protein